MAVLKVVWAFAKRKPLGGVCIAILLFFLILALFGTWIRPQDPLATNTYDRLQWVTAKHWFGTDHLGRDVLSRIVSGAKLSYIVAVVSTLSGMIIGMVFALVSSYYGGRVDTLIQRLVDIGMAIPMLILAMSSVAVLGPSVVNVVLAITIAQVPGNIRVFRSQLLAIRETEYVMAARALGASAIRVMGRHMAPNTFAVAVIYTATHMGNAVLIEASLSFLGIGIPPPFPSWGLCLKSGICPKSQAVASKVRGGTNFVQKPLPTQKGVSCTKNEDRYVLSYEPNISGINTLTIRKRVTPMTTTQSKTFIPASFIVMDTKDCLFPANPALRKNLFLNKNNSFCTKRGLPLLPRKPKFWPWWKRPPETPKVAKPSNFQKMGNRPIHQVVQYPGINQLPEYNPGWFFLRVKCYFSHRFSFEAD